MGSDIHSIKHKSSQYMLPYKLLLIAQDLISMKTETKIAESYNK